MDGGPTWGRRSGLGESVGLCLGGVFRVKGAGLTVVVVGDFVESDKGGVYVLGFYQVAKFGRVANQVHLTISAKVVGIAIYKRAWQMADKKQGFVIKPGLKKIFLPGGLFVDNCFYWRVGGVTSWDGAGTVKDHPICHRNSGAAYPYNSDFVARFERLEKLVLILRVHCCKSLDVKKQ